MPVQLIRDDIGGREALYWAARQLVREAELRREVQKLRLSLQDAWLLMYLLVDATQDSNDPGREKYYSPRPANIVDTARRVLAKNPMKYHIVGRHMPTDEGDYSVGIRNFENVLHGLMYDFDRQLRARGQQSTRQQAAFHALVRGAWAYRLHLTKAAKSPTGSPVVYEHLDPRRVYPVWDSYGLESSVVHNVATLGQLVYQYPDQLRTVVDALIASSRRSRNARLEGSDEIDYTFLHVPLDMYEWSSREEQGLLLDMNGLPDGQRRQLGIEQHRWTDNRFIWLQEPFKHGFDRAIVQYGNVNGVPVGLVDREAATQFSHSALLRMPLHTGGDTTQGFVTAPVLFLANGRQHVSTNSVVDPAGALAGRAIYANVAHMFPELNRLFALLKQATTAAVKGTWAQTTRQGNVTPVSIGKGLVNPLAFGEKLEQIPHQLYAPDMLQVLQYLSQEISDGTIDLRFILASEMEAGSPLRARLEQAALISIEDYRAGMEDYAVSVAESFTAQYRHAGREFADWTLVGRAASERTRYFVVDVDQTVSQLLTEGEEPPVIEATAKVAMPVDMVARINMAKLAIDPANPIMSLAMALDLIMEFDDPEAAEQQILRDVGNRNPTIVLLRIANAFTEAGAQELADMILQDNFRSAFANQATNQTGASVTEGGSSPGVPAETAPPEITGGPNAGPAPGGRTTAPPRLAAAPA